MWTCRNCGETSEDNFDACWRCQTEKDETPSADRAYFSAPEGSLPRAQALICPKCSSDKIIPEVRIIDRNAHSSVEDLCFEIYENPHALLFRGTHRGALRAWICGACGYTELYVDYPGELYEVYRSAKGD